jgi:hypothetical protein
VITNVYIYTDISGIIDVSIHDSPHPVTIATPWM